MRPSHRLRVDRRVRPSRAVLAVLALSETVFVPIQGSAAPPGAGVVRMRNTVDIKRHLLFAPLMTFVTARGHEV